MRFDYVSNKALTCLDRLTWLDFHDFEMMRSIHLAVALVSYKA
jgi:hypothetical protein